MTPEEKAMKIIKEADPQTFVDKIINKEKEIIDRVVKKND
jgi:hypothetical protein